jgi:hypothetical protein
MLSLAAILFLLVNSFLLIAAEKELQTKVPMTAQEKEQYEKGM